MKEILPKHRAYKYTLFMVLALTRAFSRADYHIPTRWYSIIDSLQVSSGILHERISTLDEDVEKKFREKERMIDRRLGKEKFYSPNEIKQVREKLEDIKV